LTGAAPPQADGPPKGAAITFRELNFQTVREVLRLDVAAEQKGNVASNAVSIAQAYFHPRAWFRAIDADGVPVGFIMVYDPGLSPVKYDDETDELFLWRFMIDQRYQGRGFGAAAIQLLLNQFKGRADYINVSWVPGPAEAAGFYRKLGFAETGEMDGAEVIARYTYPKE